MRTAYSQYNLMKFHVLHILKDGKWHHWHEIYQKLPNKPRPAPDSFRDYLLKLWKKGHYKTYIIKKDDKLIRERKYLKRRYVLRQKRRKKVYYKISAPGMNILSKLESSINLNIRH